ncbi:MAG TPA: hypothetical protein VD884_13195 [Ohtaekwangia sp.]|nr:hypothetical protein [Ohtaekwangia sp.]
MKILVFVPVWKRPEITEICFMGIKRLQKVPGYEVNGFAVISEPNMIGLCEKYGIGWCLTANNPLGAKKNFGVKQALRYDFDYMIEIGSDDLLKDDVLDAYNWDAPVIGLMDFAIIDTFNGRCKRLSTNIPKFGAGRAIKRYVLESFTLWHDAKNRGLDNSSSINMAVNRISQRGIRSEQPLSVALKSDVNLWSYNVIKGVKYPIESALNGLSEEEVTAIKALQYATA